MYSYSVILYKLGCVEKMSDNMYDIICDLVKESSAIGMVIYDMSDESYEKLKKLEDYTSYQSVELCGWNELHKSKRSFSINVGDKCIGDFLNE